MWYEHWGLVRDPFQDEGAPYVPLASHDEAVARLLHLIDSAEPVGFLRGDPGSGKSRVLGRALEAARRPDRKFAMATGRMGRDALLGTLARKLGGRPAEAATESAALRSLRQAVAVCRIQGAAVVLVVDGDPEDADQRGLLVALLGLAREAGRVTVIAAGEDGDEAGEAEEALASWSLRIRMPRLTFTEAEGYVRGRLDSAGCPEPLFGRRAMARLHLLSGGTPRGLNRLASLSLMAASLRRLEAVPSDLVDDVSGECRLPVGLGPPA
ncbi:hypothetical protein OJF2_62330 [Aquisphaera giovannonii]|uniref:ORC1/DEAH AAA+ ATPase domain-containing protein n=1 Tax=Aquisphaera giovannonii TaxID=406548 RepID=A0A5B9WAS6_9BACT|nr:ATP-binding protein [Aquisphaera giovannonii]QEH37642.1 hypothetical protein OJF2_62330 [Aquisphaera giovannonii]